MHVLTIYIPFNMWTLWYAVYENISSFLMFVPCIVRCSRNNQHNAQICTTALFYMLAPTCFGSSLPSSGSFWIRLSYVKIQIDMVVYHIMLVKWPVCRNVVVQSVVLPSWAGSWEAQQTELCFPYRAYSNINILSSISTPWYTIYYMYKYWYM
jgi:hypothetical protein